LHFQRSGGIICDHKAKLIVSPGIGPVIKRKKNMKRARKIYHENDFGFTRKCSCQDAVHVHFGNVAQLLNHAQLREFASYVFETLRSYADVHDHEERSIYIRTRDCGLMFTLNYSELKLLNDILENTILMIEVETVLSN